MGVHIGHLQTARSAVVGCRRFVLLGKNKRCHTSVIPASHRGHTCVTPTSYQRHTDVIQRFKKRFINIEPQDVTSESEWFSSSSSSSRASISSLYVASTFSTSFERVADGLFSVFSAVAALSSATALFKTSRTGVS